MAKADLKVGIIGCGRTEAGDQKRRGISHLHAQGYLDNEETRIVALADIVPAYAEAFRDRFGGERIYTDYREMLEKEALDVVSVCTWPHLHAEMVVAAAQAGVRAVHCEKPMATTYGDARRMVEACAEAKVQLTINHQRRFGPPFRKARDLVSEGAIGELRVFEGRCSNLYDWGTHWFDMGFFLNGDTPAEWVMAQIDLRESRQVFGAWCEGHGISQYRFQNGVAGHLFTGVGMEEGPPIRLIGTDGVIEIKQGDGSALRLLGNKKGGWENMDTGSIHGPQFFSLAIRDLVESLLSGREPELSGRKALQATELVFASYESCRRRGRVDLPLKIDDSPIEALVKEWEGKERAPS